MLDGPMEVDPKSHKFVSKILYAMETAETNFLRDTARQIFASWLRRIPTHAMAWGNTVVYFADDGKNVLVASRDKYNESLG